MKLFLDTQILLWAAAGTLPKKAAELIANEKNALLFSAASIREIVIKKGLKRPDFQVDVFMLHNGLLSSGYAEVSVNGYHTIMVGNLPSIHKDPFDRIIIAQAQYEKATIVTSDDFVARYPCQVIHIKPPRRT